MTKKDSYEQFLGVLKSLGHLYIEDAPEVTGVAQSDLVRHLCRPNADGVALACLPNDEVPETAEFLTLPELFSDINCPKCRKILEIDEMRPITKRTLLVNSIHSIMSIEQRFIETMYWNICRSAEGPINPDPDGLLAATWQERADFLIAMIERARPLMESYGARYGWPTELDEEK